MTMNRVYGINKKHEFKQSITELDCSTILVLFLLRISGHVCLCSAPVQVEVLLAHQAC